MASAMASAATRNIPSPYTIPIGPRVRPPRLLPGTKAANTNPQPDEPPPTAGDVWVQGKWRNPSSNAARDRRQVQSVRAEKALRHTSHGTNIYAYNHIRTNQVVYSLTRVMQNNKILSQLMYFGKQTVPAALRRDLWRPYFSIHFPETTAGQEAGLKAYRRLRELSAVRQLSPPSELIMATEEDVQKAKNKYTPLATQTRLRNRNMDNLPIKNQLLPKKLRARKLMDQKAFSVADAAHVLSLVNSRLSPEEEQARILQQRAHRYERLSSRATRRMDKIKEQEAAKDMEIQARQEIIQPGESKLGLTPHAARRIALEYGTVVSNPQKGMEYRVTGTENTGVSSGRTQSLPAGDQRLNGSVSDETKLQKEESSGNVEPPAEEFEAAVTQESSEASRSVDIFWADIRDATWAKQWPSNVKHGILEPKAAIKQERVLLQQATTIDEEGNELPGPLKRVIVQSSNTPHVFGTGKSLMNALQENPEQERQEREKTRNAELSDWQALKLEKSREILAEIDALNKEKERLSRQQLQMQPEIRALERLEASLDGSSTGPQVSLSRASNAAQNLTDSEKYELRTSMAKIEDEIAANSNESLELERDYPSLHGIYKELRAWGDQQRTYSMLLNRKEEIENLSSDFDAQNVKVSARLQQIDTECGPYLSRHLEGEGSTSFEANLQSELREHHQAIARFEQQIADLEASRGTPQTQSDIASLEKRTGDRQRAITIMREESHNKRLNAFAQELEHIEDSPDYRGTDIMDLLKQRAHAERQTNTEQIESINNELDAREQDKLAQLLGQQISRDPAPNVVEVDEAEIREKGIETPATPRRTGFMGRVKGLFGR